MRDKTYFFLESYYYFNLRWVNHHFGNIQNGEPSGPVVMAEEILTQVSGEGICFVRNEFHTLAEARLRGPQELLVFLFEN